MREIKFRAWNVENKAMIKTPISLATIVSRYIKEFRPDSYGWGGKPCENTPEAVKPEDYIILQFTGLKDKNGVEIYEGDILGYWGDACWVVAYKDYRWRLVSGREGWNGSLGLTPYVSKGKIVIGNIYQNPELLK